MKKKIIIIGIIFVAISIIAIVVCFTAKKPVNQSMKNDINFLEVTDLSVFKDYKNEICQTDAGDMYIIDGKYGNFQGKYYIVINKDKIVKSYFKADIMNIKCDAELDAQNYATKYDYDEYQFKNACTIFKSNLDYIVKQKNLKLISQVKRYDGNGDKSEKEITNIEDTFKEFAPIGKNKMLMSCGYYFEDEKTDYSIVIFCKTPYKCCVIINN